MDGNEFRRVALVASLREKKLNDLFGFVVVAFAEMMIAPAPCASMKECAGQYSLSKAR